MSDNGVPIGTNALTLQPGRSESDELQDLLVFCPVEQHTSVK